MKKHCEHIRVLLIDNHPEQCAQLEELFFHAKPNSNDEFLVAHSLNNALDLLHNTSCTAVLARCSEVEYEQFHGILRIHGVAPMVPVVVYGESDDLNIAHVALSAGAQDYLVESHLTSESLYRALRFAMQRMYNQEQLAYRAQFDSVTGLPNRMLFRDRLDRALIHAQRKDLVVAIMFLDLDYFKSINDSLGHDAGDALLQQVASRLQSLVRRGDTVARLGGDEFTIILEELHDARAAGAIAEKIIDSMARVFVVANEEMFISTSIGITMYPQCGTEPGTLIRHADTALYHAKEAGRGCFRFYSNEMNAVTNERHQLLGHLRLAMARDEFTLYYQPQLDPRTHAVVGVEALLRWNRPQAGIVAPSEFIELLEESGLIIAVGEWILRKACEQMRAWRDAGLPPMRVAVNLSARQFRQKNLVSMIATLIRDTGIDARNLQLEITESMLVENISVATATVRALHTIGVEFAIDDFGTGYSSLSYLKQFPLHALKVDRSFLRNFRPASDDTAIITAIVTLGHNLRLKVVAEGVETEQQLEFLRAVGCDAVQGYLFAQPMPACETAEWIVNHARKTSSAVTTISRAS